MLIATRKYLMQVIEAQTGNRGEPFISTPAEFQELIIKNFDYERDSKYYVLLLADTTLDIKPQHFVSRFPLYTIESWTNLTFNAEAPTEEENHG